MTSPIEPRTGAETGLPTSPSLLAARRRKRRSRIGVGILLGVVAGNALAAAAYLAMGGVGDDPAPKTAGTIVEPAGPSALARAHRRAGLEALEREDFSGAVDAFRRSLVAPGPPEDVAELLGIAEKLRDEAREPVERSFVEASESTDAASASERADPRAAGGTAPELMAPTEPAPERVAPTEPAPERAAPTPSRRPSRRAGRSRERARPQGSGAQRSAASASTARPDPTPAAGDTEGVSPRATDAEAEGLPVCPERFEAGSTSPYAIIPRNCRPR